MTVIDGEIIDVETPNDYVRDLAGCFESISGIYDQIAIYYEQNSTTLKNGQSLHIDIRYNVQYHYPEYVSGGIYERNPPNGGSYLYYEILNFQPLP